MLEWLVSFGSVSSDITTHGVPPKQSPALVAHADTVKPFSGLTTPAEVSASAKSEHLYPGLSGDDPQGNPAFGVRVSSLPSSDMSAGVPFSGQYARVAMFAGP